MPVLRKPAGLMLEPCLCCVSRPGCCLSHACLCSTECLSPACAGVAAFWWKGENKKDSAKTFGFSIGDEASEDLFRTEVCKVFESAKQWAIENLEEHHY